MIRIADVADQLDRMERDIHANLRAGHSLYLAPDDALGWTIGRQSRHHSLPYESDEDGFRKVAKRSSSRAKELLFLGDSYVHGDELSNDECWTAQLGRMTLHHVHNAGVPGYGTDQALMRYEVLAPSYSFDTVFLGLPTCDVVRNINVLRLHRTLRTTIPFMKPLYVSDELGGIRAIRPPFAGLKGLKEHYLQEQTQEFLRKYDFFYPKRIDRAASWRSLWSYAAFSLASEVRFEVDPFLAGTAITLAILSQFIHLVTNWKSKGLVLLLPVDGQVSSVRDTRLEALSDALQRLMIPHIDMRSAFLGRDLARYRRSEIWCPNGHYGSQSSLWLAEYLAKCV